MGTHHLLPRSGLRQITGTCREPLHDGEATRHIEQLAASTLPPHSLMSRAGESAARLANAIAPHARCIWIACGPGNNGGDGLIAATKLHREARATGRPLEVLVTHDHSQGSRLPSDARHALDLALKAGVRFVERPPAAFDLAIDALFGIGGGKLRPFDHLTCDWLSVLRECSQPVLCLDLPSGLHPRTGALAPIPTRRCNLPPGPRHTLSLLTLKPGLFTGAGKEAAGAVWFDDLGTDPDTNLPVTAWLAGRTCATDTALERPHTSHKGTFGDVVVIGGESIAIHGAGMTGAAVLAATAALHAGAGRVFVGLLEGEVREPTRWDPVHPELMFRHPQRLLDPTVLGNSTVVCGCGGGTSIGSLLHRVLSDAERLVLDADGLNAVASEPALQAQLGRRRDQGRVTVLTPHPLEAARLLGVQTKEVMEDRWHAARSISQRYGAVCVLKGSGTIISAPGAVPLVNPSGNASLATAGTGDVLAGMIGSALAPRGLPASEMLERVAAAVHEHGRLADEWSNAVGSGLSASRLAARVRPLSR